MSDDFEYELDEFDLKEIKRALVSYRHHIEFDAKMGFNYHVCEEYDYIPEIIAKVDKMIERQKERLVSLANSNYNDDAEILSDGDVPF